MEWDALRERHVHCNDGGGEPITPIDFGGVCARTKVIDEKAEKAHQVMRQPPSLSCRLDC